MDPRNGQILTVPGTANTQAAIGTPIPGSGNPLNGIRQAGDGIAKTGYTWPAIVVGPRFGVAYDITGDQTTVLRARRRHLLRPSGRQHRLLDPGQPADRRLRGPSLRHAADPRPRASASCRTRSWSRSSTRRRCRRSGSGSGRAARAAVGHGHRPVVCRQPRLQPDGRASGWLDRQPELDRHRHGLPAAEPGSDQGREHRARRDGAWPTNLLRPYQGLANINQNTTEFWDTYHSLQASLNRRFRNGFSFGANYTYGISYKGNLGLQQRFVHNADGSFQLRDDQDEYEKLNETLDRRPHSLKANAVWDLPNVTQHGQGRRRDPQRLAPRRRADRWIGCSLRPRASATRTTAATRT